MPHAQITGIGSWLPERRLTNADLERMVDTSDEWILQRVGISERRVVAEGETTSDLAARAGLAAIKDAGLTREAIDLVVLASSSPDYVFPSTAAITQGKMGLPPCAAFDVMAACTGFVYALQVAWDAVNAGRARHALVIGAEAVTRHIDFQDRSTCVLFGDGAAAVVLAASEEPGMLSSEMRADGTQESVLRIPIGAANPPSAEMLAHRGQYMTMAGNEVYKFAVRAIPDITREAAEAAGVEVGDLRWIIPHQANQRILDTVAERLDVPADRVASVIRDTGNTSAASIPLALDRLYTAGNLAAGDLIALVGFGAGLTWGATVLRWTKEARS